MAKEFSFSLQENGLIIVAVQLNVGSRTTEVKMMLDTGCTHTVLHTKYAKLLGVDLKKAPKTRIDTGSQEEKARDVLIDIVASLDHYIENLTITVFDVYIDHNLYAGYLGLDFLAGKKLTIDFATETISVS
jgi:predicted aspartyl protease